MLTIHIKLCFCQAKNNFISIFSAVKEAFQENDRMFFYTKLDGQVRLYYDQFSTLDQYYGGEYYEREKY